MAILAWPGMIAALTRPEAYPFHAPSVEVRHTHASIVYLTANFAYKLKKPVNLGFLDFSTLEKRLHFCREEVRLNRRLAPSVYLGVVPVVRLPDGGYRFEGEGEPAEWAVKMVRLPDEATLLARLDRGELDTSTVADLARRVARFHREAASSPEVAAHGRFAVVAHNARENFEQARPHIGTTIHRAVWNRLVEANERELRKLEPLMEARVGSGHIRDTHGDLHLDHVYAFPGRSGPDDLLVLDCVEFSGDYRCGDTVADMAFLVMDLLFHNRPALARDFADIYFEETGDVQGRALLDFYVAYRAAVRGKVEGLEAREIEVPETERHAAICRARAHWLLAFGRLEPPAQRPVLVLVGGLPGTGKSRLAVDLEQRGGFCRIATDEVRKELAGLSPTQSGAARFGAGIYTPEWNARVYAECLQRAGAALFEGKRVVVEGSFREEPLRQQFLKLAVETGVPCWLLVRTAAAGTVEKRLALRRDSVSDADWNVYREAARRWEPYGVDTKAHVREIPAQDEKEQAWEIARLLLEAEGLM